MTRRPSTKETTYAVRPPSPPPRPPSRADPAHRPRAPARLPRPLGAELDRRGDAVALLGLGSVGRDLHRLDEHSDADFFVVVDDGATRDRYLADIDWLEAAHPVVWSFENSDSGRKALLEGDLFAEYAVFSLRRHGDRGLSARPHPLAPCRRTRGARGAEDTCAAARLARAPGRRGDHQPLRRAAPGPARRAPHRDPLHPGVCRGPLDHDPRPPRARSRGPAGRLRHRPWRGATLRSGPAAAGRPRARLRAQRARGGPRCCACSRHTPSSTRRSRPRSATSSPGRRLSRRRARARRRAGAACRWATSRARGRA